MKISRAAAGVSFFGALAIGIVVAGLFAAEAVVAVAEPMPQVRVTYTLTEPAFEPRKAVEVQAKDLRGTWRGTWGYDHDACTVEIKRVNGDQIFGTLYKDEAVISIVGEFDAEGQRVLLRETKVMSLGVYDEWSLGTNTGTFSANGRMLSGTGIDKWGTYNWSVTKE
jgi:hypothetical protein